jgi:type I site-specific restriction endonuclease
VNAVFLTCNAFISVLIIAVQAKCDKAIEAARVEERERFEASVADLKQRLEMMTMSRRESDERCQQLIKDLKVQQEQFNETLCDLRGQLNTLEEELRRQRNIAGQLQDLLTNTETANKALTAELQDTNQRLMASDDQNRTLQRALTEARGSVQILETRLKKVCIQKFISDLLNYLILCQGYQGLVACMDRSMDCWIDGWLDRWIDECIHIRSYEYSCIHAFICAYMHMCLYQCR